MLSYPRVFAGLAWARLPDNPGFKNASANQPMANLAHYQGVVNVGHAEELTGGWSA